MGYLDSVQLLACVFLGFLWNQVARPPFSCSVAELTERRSCTHPPSYTQTQTRILKGVEAWQVISPALTLQHTWRIGALYINATKTKRSKVKYQSIQRYGASEITVKKIKCWQVNAPLNQTTVYKSEKHIDVFFEGFILLGDGMNEVSLTYLPFYLISFLIFLFTHLFIERFMNDRSECMLSITSANVNRYALLSLSSSSLPSVSPIQTDAHSSLFIWGIQTKLSLNYFSPSFSLIRARARTQTDTQK